METNGGSQGADVSSLVARQAFIDGSKILQVQGTPAHALFHSDKYLVGDVTINIRIDLQSEAFCLMSSAGTERLEILNTEFMVHYVKISDSVRLQHIAIMSGTGRKVSVLDPPSTLWNEEMSRLTTLPRVSRVSKKTICFLARYRDAWSWVWSETMRTRETKLAIHLIPSSLI